jgi:hypothetical protein
MFGRGFGVKQGNTMNELAKEAAKLAAKIRDHDPTYQMRPQLYDDCDTDGGKRSLHETLTKCSKKMNCGPVPKWREGPTPTPPAPVVSYPREATHKEQGDGC